jgi:hypothetical protein
MFDQLLDVVKEQMGKHPEASKAIPQGQADAVHREVASQVNNQLKHQAGSQGGIGGLLSQLSGGITSGHPVTDAIQGGLVGTLGSKFGLPPAATGAIAAALPGILQKFAHKANDPNDQSITQESLTKSLGGSLGNFF